MSGADRNSSKLGQDRYLPEALEHDVASTTSCLYYDVHSYHDWHSNWISVTHVIWTPRRERERVRSRLVTLNSYKSVGKEA